MTAHRETERRRHERLRFLLDRPARAPPPSAMHEGAVGGVHQPDYRVIDRGGETDALDKIGGPSFETLKHGDLRAAGRVLAKKYPDVSLRLAHRVGTSVEVTGRERLSRHQRGDRCAAATRIE